MGPSEPSAQRFPPTAATDLPTDKTEEKVGVIKIKYLAVRSCWQMYLENSTALELEVEGSKLSSIFKAWFAVKSIYNNRKIRISSRPHQRPA